MGHACPTQNSIEYSHLEVQLIVLGTAGVEARGTAGTFIPRAQVLVYGQFAATAPAEHGFCVAFVPWPYFRRMTGQGVMTADTGVVLAAALMLDGDDVQVRVPVSALRGGGDVDAVDERRLETGISVFD